MPCDEICGESASAIYAICGASVCVIFYIYATCGVNACVIET